MKETPTPEIKCPNCGHTSFTPNQDGILICDHCQAGRSQPERECPSCGALNPLQARKCLACGQELAIVDAMFTRLTRTTSDQLRHVRESGVSAREREDAASEERLAKMWDEEDRRRQALAQARAERDRQERVMVTVALGVVAFVIVVAIIVAIIATSGAPGVL